MERDTQPAVGDVTISDGLKEFVDQSTSLFLGARVVRLEHDHQIALGSVVHRLTMLLRCVCSVTSLIAPHK